ncbi:tyrosine decarboxylase / aspartate 1-decarboxylase [Halopelagius inordinatus]|uniref:Probable L-aspartate decarboxylase n=1 Tax=Halopelagius inordinatus TaxID=553467 RepID=A0A1I2MYJ8_9EURY|nr:tyrosine decarboxylase MfnA [Halopelagius inordinatus]SFF94396.1 tyrosine decarboxylase / aspartate 1-decarboxylase [Halopelagius inordinatus]
MQRAAPQEFSRVLSSMCTEPHPAARDAAERFLATNPGDPETYQEVARLERRAVETLGEIADLSDPHGYVTSGGTEANVQAVRSARNRLRVEDPNVVVPESAHFSFTKAADVLGVELRRVPTDDDHRADVDAADAAVDDDTVLVVGVAGSTEFGRVDPIPELAAVAHDAGAFLHVDAAWGGFYLPFTDHEWSFAHAPVDSMTIDPHKSGRAAVPAGGVLFRERAGLDALAVDTPYLESTSQATLTGTRSGAGVAAAAAAMDALWPDGYRREYERVAELATWFAAELRERGFETADVDLPLVAASISEPVFERLREEGWRISRTESGELRVVCMPHVTREMLTAFLADVEAVHAAGPEACSLSGDVGDAR